MIQNMKMMLRSVDKSITPITSLATQFSLVLNFGLLFCLSAMEQFLKLLPCVVWFLKNRDLCSVISNNQQFYTILIK